MNLTAKKGIGKSGVLIYPNENGGQFAKITAQMEMPGTI